MRMFIRPCFEFNQCQLREMGEIKTRANKTCSTSVLRIKQASLYIFKESCDCKLT